MLREVGINPPIASGVGMGQGVASNTRGTEAQVIKLGALYLQACFDIAQALAPRELSERQTAKLIMAGEVLDLPVAIIMRDATAQGCSTLSTYGELKQPLDAAEGCPVPVLYERSGLVDSQDVEGEAAQPGEYAGIDADAGGVFVEGNIAGIVAAVFYAPVGADGLSENAG